MPVIYIHINYYYTNKGKEYELKPEAIVITNASDNTRKIFLKSDIEKVSIHLSPKKNKNSDLSFLTFEDYYYIKIIMKDKDELLLTSLLDDNLKNICEKYFNKQSIEYSVNLYNLI